MSSRRSAPGRAQGRMATRSAAKARSVPSRASVDIAAVMSATAEQPAQVVESEQQHAEDAVRAVDQREPLLGGERQRLDARRRQCLGRGDTLSGGVRPRPRRSGRDRSARAGEIAARGARPCSGTAAPSPAASRASIVSATAGRAPERPMAGSGRAGTSSRGRPRARPAGPSRPSANGSKRAEAPRAGRRNPGARQRAEASRDAIDRLLQLGEALDDRGALLHRRTRLGRQSRPRSVAGHGDHVGRLDTVAR